MDLVGAACTVRWAASLLLCNVVNWAKSYVQVEYANMEFFILNFILSYLPVHMMTPSRPPLARLLVADVKELVGEVRDTYAACGGLPGVRPGSVSEYSPWEKCLE